MNQRRETEGPRKKRVLVLTLAPPLPALAGGDIYALNSLPSFAEEIEFHLLTYVSSEADKEKLKEHRSAYDALFASVTTVARPPLPFGLARWQRFAHLMGHTLRNLPFVDASYFSREALSKSSDLVRSKGIDALEINSTHLAFFKKYLKKPAILISHNIEQDIFPFWIPQGMNPLSRAFVTWVAGRSRRIAYRVEQANAYGFEAMTFISKVDMARVHGNTEKIHMPLFFDDISSPRWPPGRNGKFRVLWMGGFGWYPNLNAVEWFVENVYPILAPSLEQQGIELHFCGSNPPGFLRRLHDGKHIFVHGFVDDIDEIMVESDLLMVPMQVGGGVRVKVVEAMSKGLPVLSTTKGCEGIEVTPWENIVVQDDPRKFAEAILELSGRQEYLYCLSANAIAFINERHSLEAGKTAKRMAYRKIGVLN